MKSGEGSGSDIYVVVHFTLKSGVCHVVHPFLYLPYLNISSFFCVEFRLLRTFWLSPPGKLLVAFTVLDSLQHIANTNIQYHIMGTDGPVYLGVWTNWSKGSAVLGATLTMTREYGNFLVAFTALFIPFVASRFWRIFAIWFHQCYSSPDQRDTLHHQRQIVLRNSTSPESGLISFIRLLWAWRRVARRPLLRILPVAIFAFFSIAFFTVAGVFTSEISKADEVLVNGDHCKAGSNLVFDWEDIETASASYVYWGTFVEKVANYARQCYTNDSSGLLECSRLITGSISTASQDGNAPCPFDPSVCRKSNSNLRLDSGHLNSNDIFGLNARRDETLTFRYVLQVSIILRIYSTMSKLKT